MKKAIIIIGCILLGLLLTSCTVCSGNYFEYKRGNCCIDINKNGVCDYDESGTNFQSESNRVSDINKASTAISKAGNQSALQAIQSSLSGECWFYVDGTREDGSFGNLWKNLANEPIKCSVKQDCIDFMLKLVPAHTFYDSFGRNGENVSCSTNGKPTAPP